MFVFKTADLHFPVKCSKRVVLSIIAKVFDPLGFVLPFTVGARFMFQDIWRLGLSWDDDLPEQLKEVFSTWLNQLQTLENATVPRQYFDGRWSDCMSFELHAFGDASLRG